jgi:hypothetical protein
MRLVGLAIITRQNALRLYASPHIPLTAVATFVSTWFR